MSNNQSPHAKAGGGINPVVLKTVGGVSLAVLTAVGISLYTKANHDCWLNRGGADSTEDVIAIDIAVVPPEEVLSLCKEINAEIARRTTSFVFDATHYPHITLTHMYVKMSQLHLLMERLSSALQKVFPLTDSTQSKTVQLSHLDVGPEWSPNVSLPYIGCAKKGLIMTLHSLITDITAPFRQRPVRRTWIRRTPKNETLSYVQKCFYTEDIPVTMSTAVYAEDFDYKSSKDCYNPHITIGSGDPVVIAEVLEQFMPKIASLAPFSLDDLAIYQLGEFGACRNFLFELSFLENRDSLIIKSSVI